MKSINDIIIISDYDFCYILNVWFNGEESCKEALDICRMYESCDNRSLACIMNKYHKDVLLCCDGSIEYFEYKEVQ